MKDKIKVILSALGFIIVIIFAVHWANYNENDEAPIINVCGEDIYIADYYNKGI